MMWRLDKAPSVQALPHGRIVSASAVILAHAVLVAAMVWYRAAAPSFVVPPPQPIMIDLVSSAPKAASPLDAPRIVNPSAPVIAMPEFKLDVPQPNTITTQPPNAGAPASPVGRDSYYARLLSYLDSRKRYPPEARRLHIEGTVRIQFRIDRSGRVLEFAVVGSSGRPILDEEVKALIARAQPLPLPPADMADAGLNLVVPVEFRLR